MWGRREFLESSSSDELSPKPFQSISTDVSNNPPVKFIAKPPPTRPITANARIMSIQRAKLLDRGTGSIRVQVSPFYRTSSIEITQSPPQISKKPPVPNKKVPEDLEEIKVADLKTSPKKNPKDIKVKDFLSEEKPENNSKEWLSQTKTFEEIAPQPTYQRVKLQSSTSLRARPQSQITVRSNSKEFKTITTVSVKKPIPPSVKQHSVDQKNNLFAPVPLGSKLFCIIKRNNQEVYQQYPKYSVVLASNGIQVMSASRVRGKYGGNYVVSLSDKDFSKNSLFFLGEVKTEAGHRSMSFFRFRPKKSTVKVLKKQDGTVIYVNST